MSSAGGPTQPLPPSVSIKNEVKWSCLMWGALHNSPLQTPFLCKNGVQYQMDSRHKDWGCVWDEMYDTCTHIKQCSLTVSVQDQSDSDRTLRGHQNTQDSVADNMVLSTIKIILWFKVMVLKPYYRSCYSIVEHKYIFGEWIIGMRIPTTQAMFTSVLESTVRMYNIFLLK